jgi:hypothetical protein
MKRKLQVGYKILQKRIKCYQEQKNRSHYIDWDDPFSVFGIFYEKIRKCDPQQELEKEKEKYLQAIPVPFVSFSYPSSYNKGKTM